MRIAYLMNGLIGNLTSKNMVNADLESRPLIINYTSSSHKYLCNNDIKIIISYRLYMNILNLFKYPII